MGIFDAFGTALQALWHDSGFYSLTMGNVIMMLVGCVLMYMAFAKEFEPLLLGPISFGCVIATSLLLTCSMSLVLCSSSATVSSTKYSPR